jgi:hypothetical protein
VTVLGLLKNKLLFSALLTPNNYLFVYNFVDKYQKRGICVKCAKEQKNL